MKIARILPALPLALLAAAAWAKPGAPSASGGDAWRAQAVRVCVAGMQDSGDARAVDAACGCAADRFLARRPDGAPPPPTPRDLRALDANDLVECAAERGPAFAAQVVRRVADLAVQQAAQSGTAPPGAVPPANGEEAKLADGPAPAPAEAPKPAADSRPLLDRLSLPAWLIDSGLPFWAWAALAGLAFLLLRGLFRRDDRRDLVAPPASMRRMASPRPMVQRPPAPPRS